MTIRQPMTLPERREIGLTTKQYNILIARFVIGQALNIERESAPALILPVLIDKWASRLQDVSLDGLAIDTAQSNQHVGDVFARISASIAADMPSHSSEVSEIASAIERSVQKWLSDPFDPIAEIWSVVVGLCAEVYRDRGCATRAVEIRASWHRSLENATGLQPFDIHANTFAGEVSVVELSFHPSSSFETFLTLPYVLLHEVLVHCHASTIVSSDENPFAEGWMDCVAASLLDDVLERLPNALQRHVPDIRDTCTRRHGDRYTRNFQATNSYSAARRQGRAALNAVRNLLRNFSDITDIRDILLELSVSLNAATVEPARVETLMRRLATWSQPDAENVSGLHAVSDALDTWIRDRSVERFVETLLRSDLSPIT